MRRRFNERKMAGIIFLVILCIFAFSGIVMLLWNALLPQLFHFPVITIWQALGLLVLTKILFGGFRGGPGFRHKRDNLRQAWMNMNPEQREKFKQEWGRGRGRSCRGDAPFEQEGPYGQERPFTTEAGTNTEKPA